LILSELINHLVVLQEEHGDKVVDVYCEAYGEILILVDIYQWRDDALVITVRDNS
jgi:hypothetical protein